MNSLSLKKAAVLLALALLPLLGIAQPHHHHGPAPQIVPPHDSMAFHKPGDYHAGPMLSLPNGLTTYKVCQTPMGFALIDSIDNSIDLVIVSHDAEKTISRSAYYTVDTYKGRYDLNRILRPVSLQAVGNDIVFLATSSDSSFIGVLQSTAEADADGHQTYQLTLSASYGFPCHSDVFEYNPRERQIQVVGFNPTGYDINILDLAGGLDHLDQATLTPFHYHVPKQAEKIKASDPYGVGLTSVAVLVVFFALICIALVLKGFGKI
ncbi:MAG: hypothetical protein IJ620_05260, partial [Bacteroidales bacterium]|nr:hypothetical protein [Bacteroidales bacterium]